MATTWNGTSGYNHDVGLLERLKPAYYFYPPVLMLLGLAGNTMSFVVFSKIAPGTSISTHFRSLALTDSLYASTYLLPLWITKTFGVYVRESNDFWCKVLTFINYTAGDVSMWLVVAMAVDRCVGILKPFLAKRFSSARTALVTLAVLVMLSAGKNFSVIIAFGVNANDRHCTYQSMKFYHSKVRHWIALTVSGLLPVLTVFIISCIIGLTLKRHQKQQARLSEVRNEVNGQWQARNTKNGRERTAIILVFANSVTFLVTVMPTFINNVLRMFLSRNTLEIMQVFTILLLYCNHCLGFYVYCLSSAEYRKKVCLVMRRTLRLNTRSALFSVNERNSELLTVMQKNNGRITNCCERESDCTTSTQTGAYTRIRMVNFADDARSTLPR